MIVVLIRQISDLFPRDLSKKRMHEIVERVDPANDFVSGGAIEDGFHILGRLHRVPLGWLG